MEVVSLSCSARVKQKSKRVPSTHTHKKNMKHKLLTRDDEHEDVINKQTKSSPN